MKKKDYNGLLGNINNINKNWIYCPRCNNPAIRRENRKCMHCGGYVLFDIDDGNELNERIEHWYLFHRSVFNIIGWWDKSYFRNRILDAYKPNIK